MNLVLQKTRKSCLQQLTHPKIIIIYHRRRNKEGWEILYFYNQKLFKEYTTTHSRLYTFIFNKRFIQLSVYYLFLIKDQRRNNELQFSSAITNCTNRDSILNYKLLNDHQQLFSIIANNVSRLKMYHIIFGDVICWGQNDTQNIYYCCLKVIVEETQNCGNANSETQYFEAQKPLRVHKTTNACNNKMNNNIKN